MLFCISETSLVASRFCCHLVSFHLLILWIWKLLRDFSLFSLQGSHLLREIGYQLFPMIVFSCFVALEPPGHKHPLNYPSPHSLHFVYAGVLKTINSFEYREQNAGGFFLN